MKLPKVIRVPEEDFESHWSNEMKKSVGKTVSSVDSYSHLSDEEIIANVLCAERKDSTEDDPVEIIFVLPPTRSNRLINRRNLPEPDPKCILQELPKIKWQLNQTSAP